MISTLLVQHAASLWYPIMLAQVSEEISVAKAAELLGMTIEDYYEHRQRAIRAVMRLVNELPSGLSSLLDVMKDRPELFAPTSSASNISGTGEGSDCL